MKITKKKLRKIIKEELMNEEKRYKNVGKAYKIVHNMSAPELEQFFEFLYMYFEKDTQLLTNMDHNQIAKNLRNVYLLVQKRTSN